MTKALAEARDKVGWCRAVMLTGLRPCRDRERSSASGSTTGPRGGEQDADTEKPVVFSKFSTAVIAPGEPVVLPSTSQQVDYEAELAVVIGRRASTSVRIARMITCLATRLSTT